MKLNNKWFSIIEILIWIFIFTLWLTSVYLLIISTIRLNDYSKNSIIASNLAREWIELVRNVRDSNYQTIHKWNKLPWNVPNNLFQTGVHYKIENDYTSSLFAISLTWITDFLEWKSFLTTKMQNSKLYLDSLNRYTYNSGSTNKPTYFYRYVKFDDVVYNSWWTITIDEALKLTSKVIWYNNWYHEVELKTVLTDWQRQ